MPRRLLRAALLIPCVALGLSIAGCGVLGGSVPTAEVGECTNVADLEGDENGELTEIPTVDCSEEHDAQFYGTFTIEGDDFPGQTEINTQADDGCLERFEDFVGIPFEESALMYGHLAPNEQSWDQSNDREVLCVAWLNDGSTTTESFEDSGL